MVSVLVEDFIYQKGDEEKGYSVLVLDEDEKYVSGISLDNLSDTEKKQVSDIHRKYCEDMKPFVVKAYRKFTKDKIKEKK